MQIGSGLNSSVEVLLRPLEDQNFAGQTIKKCEKNDVATSKLHQLLDIRSARDLLDVGL